MKVFLTGFMGAGKTMVGMHLARAMSIPFFDLDHEIESTSQSSVSEIFDRFGEAEFRKMEGSMLKNITFSHDSFVVSTGGGTPCFNDQMNFMNKHGRTVWLNAPLEAILQRLKKGKASRPVIALRDDDELEGFVHNLFRERQAFYKLAQIEIRPCHQSNPEVAEMIREKLLGL